MAEQDAEPEPAAGEITALSPLPQPAAPAPQEQPPKRFKFDFSLGGGILYYGGFGGGMQWKNDGDGDEILAMPYNMVGAHLFFDAAYASISIGYSQGGGKWETPNNINPDDMPYMHRASLNIGVSVKYPGFIKTALFIAGLERRANIYPVLWLEYESPTYSRLEFGSKPEYIFDGGNKDGYDAGALNALWVKFGGGLDLHITSKIYARLEMLYGARTANWFETDQADKNGAEKTRLGHGLTVKAGAGVRL